MCIVMSAHHTIRAYRQAKNLSCAGLAKQLGVAEATLRSFENGTRPITAERAKQLELVTGGGVTRYDLRPDLFERQEAAA